MGQTITNHLEELKDDVMKEAHLFKEVIDITHEDFLQKVQEINKICYSLIESEGRCLRFFIKKDTDSTFLWKQIVRIACMRVSITDDSAALFCDESVDEESLSKILAVSNKVIKVHKLLSLRQFLLAYNIIKYHSSCIQTGGESSAQARNNDCSAIAPFSTSMLLDKIMNETAVETDTEECIICMERKPEVTLPCAHAYCLFCIEQWNVSNKTCPVCRAAMESTDDSWVTPDIPETSEVNEEIKKAVKALTFKLPES